MVKGRNSKPNEIKLIEGAERSDRSVVNSIVPPRVVDIPEIPTVLKNGAVVIWKDTIRDLQTINMLYSLDVPLLTSNCIEMNKFFMHQKNIDREGYVIKGRANQE